MIIDHIDIDKLPHVIVWLDWNFYAYFKSFTVCILLSYVHFFLKTFPNITTGPQVTSLFVGFCLWVVYAAIFKGYAVG